MANITDATNAYANALTALNKGAGALGGGQAAAGGDAASMGAFGDMVKQGLQSVVESQHKSETVSAKALTGKADATDVIQAVTDAELKLNEVIALRDKVIAAYNDLMRTQM